MTFLGLQLLKQFSLPVSKGSWLFCQGLPMQNVGRLGPRVPEPVHRLVFLRERKLLYEVPSLSSEAFSRKTQGHVDIQFPASSSL